MALSDISRKEARSDVQSRLGLMPEADVISEEINSWLNREQFNFFNRMGPLVNKWYGKKETVAVTASAGAVTEVALASNYAATKIAQITKFVLADGETVYKPVEFSKLEHMLGITTYDSEYAYAIYGENLYVFVGASAAALSPDSSVLYFIRKPDEMAGDINVHTITVTDASMAADDTVTINGIEMIVKAAATTEVADFIAGGTDDASAQNLDDVIGAIFSATSGVTVAVAANVVTVTGAKTVVTSKAAAFAIAESTASMVDVPTEFVDLIIMGAQSKAMGKLNMVGERQQVEGTLSQRYAEISQMYGQAIQLTQLEKAAGIQTPQRVE